MTYPMQIFLFVSLVHLIAVLTWYSDSFNNYMRAARALQDRCSPTNRRCGEAFFRNTFLLVQLLGAFFHSVN